MRFLLLGFVAIFAICSVETFIVDIKAELTEYIEINGTTYVIEHGSYGPRANARSYCQDKGMELVDFDLGAKELNPITEVILASPYENDGYWTSGYRSQVINVWKWETTGDFITEFFWGPDEPQNAGDPFVCILHNPKMGGWSAIDCDKVYHWAGVICEMKN